MNYGITAFAGASQMFFRRHSPEVVVRNLGLIPTTTANVPDHTDNCNRATSKAEDPNNGAAHSTGTNTGGDDANRPA